MTDLSNNNTPLKDLPEEAQIRIFKAYLAETLIWICRGEKYKAFSLWPQEIYRIPAQPPVYPWEHIEDYVEWVGVNKWGEAFGFDEEPIIDGSDWDAPMDYYELHIKFERGTVPWTETLQRRPKAEGKE